MPKLALLIAGIVVVMLPVAIFSTDISVQVRTESGDVVVCIPSTRGSTVQLQFTHSMYGGFVQETWRISPNAMLERERFVTENAAAAEYYATDGSSYRADDGYVVPTDPLTQAELVVRVNTRGNHKLIVGDHSVDLADLLGVSTQVRIQATPATCPEHALTGILERTHLHARTVGQ